MSKKNTIPVYLQVAYDVAVRIAREEICIGQKISGRTTLASEYSVSPETIRKSMKLLEEVKVVEVRHGNGVYVISSDYAESFIEQYKMKVSISELKEELLQLMSQRNEIENKMNQAMNSIVDYTSRFKNSDLISVNEFLLVADDKGIEKSIQELQLWKHTGITIVGVKRDGIMNLSPSPTFTIKANDRLFYVGAPKSSLRLGDFLRNIYC